MADPREMQNCKTDDDDDYGDDGDDDDGDDDGDDDDYVDYEADNGKCWLYLCSTHSKTPDLGHGVYMQVLGHLLLC